MAERSLAETHPEIAAQWHPTKNGNLTPNDVTFGSTKKVWWKCFDGTWPDGTFADDHEWEATIGNRSKTGCPCCSNRKAVPSNCLATTHPELAKQWHPTKNGDLTPNDVCSGWNKKVWWKCFDGTWPDGTFADDHEWEAEVRSRLKPGRASGCLKPGRVSRCLCCLGQKAVPSNCLATTHPELAKQWHPTKNGALTPNDVTSGGHTKVWWKCFDGTWPDGTFADDHEWEAKICDRSKKTGCPCCSGRQVVPSNCLATTHPELAKQWHPTKNGNLTPNDVTSGGHTKAWWKCFDGTWPDGTFADDHEWEAPIYTIKRSTCPCCYNKKVVPSNCLATTHPKLADQWHPTKNGALTPNDVTFGSRTKVWWKCFLNDHRPWEAAISSRRKQGCPTCNESKGEKAIRKYLEQHRIIFKPQYKFKTSTIKTRSFDVSVKHPMFIGLMEYQGEGHYWPVFGKTSKQKNFMDTLRRDHEKLSWCRQHNIPLLLIPFWDFKRIPEILDDVFAGRTPTFSKPPKIVKKYEPMRKKIRERLGITEPEVLCGLIR